MQYKKLCVKKSDYVKIFWIPILDDSDTTFINLQIGMWQYGNYPHG